MRDEPAATGHEQIEHTADQGVRIWGPTPEDVFREGARAFFRLMVDTSRAEPVEIVDFPIEGNDWADLLRNYLAELLYIFCADALVFCKFEFSELTETGLRATCSGEPYDPAKHPLETEIKAVTYHQLKMEQTDAGWEATVIFDL